MTTRAEFWGVSNGSVTGSRMGSLVMIVAPLGPRRPGGSIRERDRADPRETPWSEIATRLDVEFSVDLAQVEVDGARADEQPGGDLGIGGATSRQSCDLLLLGSQVAASFVDSFARLHARSEEFEP